IAHFGQFNEYARRMSQPLAFCRQGAGVGARKLSAVTITAPATKPIAAERTSDAPMTADTTIPQINPKYASHVYQKSITFAPSGCVALTFALSSQRYSTNTTSRRSRTFGSAAITSRNNAICSSMAVIRDGIYNIGP